jgi:7,8-dihydro-6-hydroxymethylpterin-pyrophosphokinase
LTLPHKHFRERAFVLQPLAEIAPDAIDPETGCTISELAGRIPHTGIMLYAASTDS